MTGLTGTDCDEESKMELVWTVGWMVKEVGEDVSKLLVTI
jgi:hypothetical protein